MLAIKSILFLILINYTLQLQLTRISAITKEFIKSLKKLSKFKVYDHDEHPFKDFSMNDIRKLLGIQDMDPTKHKISKRRNKDNRINVFGALASGSTTSQTSTSNTGTTTYNAQNMIFGAGEAADTLASLPENYMVTDRFPFCGSFVKNQGLCASCFTLSITEVLADRICVHTNMKTIVNLSPQIVLSCDRSNLGCQGGYLDKTHNFLNLYGTVEESCFPYTSGVNGLISKCPSKCVDGSPFKLYRFQKFNYFSNTDDMKMEIYKNGPITTGFAVFNDFINYKGGIYKLTTGATFLGGHAVKVIGWGVENGEEFWIAKNSWGTGWGEGGFFRFAMNHCCSFDLNGIAALPLI